jgi:hypothetical protein
MINYDPINIINIINIAQISAELRQPMNNILYRWLEDLSASNNILNFIFNFIFAHPIISAVIFLFSLVILINTINGLAKLTGDAFNKFGLFILLAPFKFIFWGLQKLAKVANKSANTLENTEISRQTKIDQLSQRLTAIKQEEQEILAELLTLVKENK